MTKMMTLCSRLCWIRNGCISFSDLSRDGDDVKMDDWDRRCLGARGSTNNIINFKMKGEKHTAVLGRLWFSACICQPVIFNVICT